MEVIDSNLHLLSVIKSSVVFHCLRLMYKIGLTGTDSWDDAVLDGIVDATTDIETAGVSVVFGKEEDRVSFVISSLGPRVLTGQS